VTSPRAAEEVHGTTALRAVGSRPPLDQDELEILGLMAEGLVLDAIARRLGISPRTVRRRLRAACDRAGVAAPVQLLVRAVRASLL